MGPARKWLVAVTYVNESDTALISGVLVWAAPLVFEQSVARQRILSPTVEPKTAQTWFGSSGQSVAGCQLTPSSLDASHVTVPSEDGTVAGVGAMRTSVTVISVEFSEPMSMVSEATEPQSTYESTTRLG